MKRITFFMAAALAIAIFPACNGNEGNQATKDSSSTTTTSSETGSTTATTTNRQITIDPGVSYVDISGKPMKLRVDTVHHYVIEEEASKPVSFYINPSTHDTFDASGRLVSGALVKGDNGSYTVDETRISSGTDNAPGNTSTGSTMTGTDTSTSSTTDAATAGKQ